MGNIDFDFNYIEGSDKFDNLQYLQISDNKEVFLKRS